MTAPTPSRGAALLAQVATVLGQFWCGLSTGHYYLRDPGGGRLVLRCCHCDKESAGWTVTRGGTP